MDSAPEPTTTVSGGIRSGVMGTVVAGIAFFDGICVGAPIALVSAWLGWPALVFGTTQSARGACSSRASRARNASASSIHASHASPILAYHAASASLTSACVRSSGRPSEWLAR